MRRTIGLSLFVTILAVGLISTPEASAEDSAAQKFTRGAINTTTGWTELPLEVAHQTSEDPYRGLTYGFIDGISEGTQRTLYGAWDWATFVIPPYNKPKMEPETVFGEAP